MTDISLFPSSKNTDLAMRWANMTLVAVVWISSLIFGLYILGFYVAALGDGDLSIWNTQALPDLYEEGEPAATIGIAIHFAMGAIILILGSIQLVEKVRDAYPNVHRLLGKIYVAASLLTAVGGLLFIAVSGTVGGTVMDIGFGLYGVLMFVCGIETFRHARAGRIENHNAWAWRLYALAIGSWLYRMEYGFWILLTDGAGMTRDFRGVFDRFMAFFFYIPNLIVVEMMIRARMNQASNAVRMVAIVLMLIAAVVVGMGTYTFTKLLWGPVIFDVFGIS